jgi:FkbM family methyltransferase
MDLEKVIKIDPKWYGQRVLLAAHDIVKELNRDTYRLYHNGRYYIILNLSEYNTMLARAVGAFEPRKFKLIERLLPRGGVFLDLGGNKGDFSLFAASIVGPQGKVICFEPHPDNITCIRLSAEKNGFNNIVVREACVSESIGSTKLYIGRASGWHTMFSTKGGSDYIARDTLTIDSVTGSLNRVDVIKIDIEGAEVLALRAAKNTLMNFRPTIALDVHRRIIGDEGIAEILELGRSWNYSAFEDRTLQPYQSGSRATAVVLVPREDEARVLSEVRRAWAKPGTIPADDQD